MRRSGGFTIVELLIVIVVIAILAAISVVAYTGIQNRAHDTAIQNDLRQLSQQIQAYIVLQNDVPYHGVVVADPTGTIRPSVSRGSYSQGYVTADGGHNLLYCRKPGSAGFALIAWSKSGNGFAYNDGSVATYAGLPRSWNSVCSDFGATTTGSDWLYKSGAWRF